MELGLLYFKKIGIFNYFMCMSVSLACAPQACLCMSEEDRSPSTGVTVGC